MEKEFIPYEQALALKELGFDEDCFGCYTEKKEVIVRVGDYRSFQNNDSEDVIIRDFNSYENGTVSAPLYQQAFRWFREKGYFYGIEICQEKHPLKSKYSFSLYGKDFYEDYPNEYGWIDDFPKFRTYEEAELECLKKLIEIVKNK